MKTLTFDIECDGLLQECTKIHCAVVYDHEMGEYHSYVPNNIHRLPLLLQTADVVIGHNIIGYDLPVLKKLYNLELDCEIVDTLIYSKLAYYDLEEREALHAKVEPKLKTSHSLKAWGQRMDFPKGEYAGGWEMFTADMLKYCNRDVACTYKLYRHLVTYKYKVPSEALSLEHKFATIIQKQTEKGWYFDTKRAQRLHVELQREKESIERELEEVFQPLYFGSIVKEYKKYPRNSTCKVTGNRVQTVGEFTPVKLTEFNAGSRKHIYKWLHHMYGWKPKEYTDKGSVIVDATILGKLPYKEAQLLSKYFDLQKVLGMIIEGKNAWLKLVDEGQRIHGELDILGAVSGRCTHRTPNLAQVPSGRSFKGKECRELFTVPEGYQLVGVDANSLELRMLAHYMAFFDKGAYGRELLNGDIHTHNQKMAGLDTRDQAKTFIYALLYGAGSGKLGAVVGGSSKRGEQLKKKFFTSIPALSKLTKSVQSKYQEIGYLRGITGRRLYIRSEHSALNTLLQSAGAYVMKYYAILLDQNLQKYGDAVAFVGNIHDEIQLEVRNDIVDEVKDICEHTFSSITTQLKWRLPLEGKAKSGLTWMDTH